MTPSLLLTLLILATTLGLFLSNRLRLDVIALLALLALFLGGVIDVREALAGFSEPLVLMIAALFVVGAALFRTGVADAIGRRVERLAGAAPARLVVVIMLVTALLSAFLSSTGTVAVMLPVVLSIARSRGISPSQLLIPLAFGALLGGMLTLIGTPPNIVVSQQLAQAGLEPFGFFAFTPVGLVLLAAGVGFMALFGGRWVPQRVDAALQRANGSAGPGWRELFSEYGLVEHLSLLRVPVGSAIASQSITSTALRSGHGVTVLAMTSPTPAGPHTRKAGPGSIIRAGDELYVTGAPHCVAEVLTHYGLQKLESPRELPQPISLVDAVIPPRSDFAGKTLRELRLHSGVGVTVLAHRPAAGESAPPDLDQPLRVGDVLLMTGGAKSLHQLAAERSNLVFLGPLPELPAAAVARAPLALLIMFGMLVAMTAGWVPDVIAVLAAAVAMVLAGCLSMEQAYRSINWESVVLIAAILPMATALDKTGGLALAVEGLLGVSEQLGPLALMAALFVLTSVLSQLVSNTATAVLVAPVALQAAQASGLNPEPLLMTVAIAASAAFITPVASPVNTLVLNPGGYRFGDFSRVGVPMALLCLAITLLVVPRVFPL